MKTKNVFSAMLFAFLCLFLLNGQAENNNQSNNQNNSQTIIQINFAGDCTLGSTDKRQNLSNSYQSYIKQNGYDYPFLLMQPLFARDDLTIINLEGVLYDATKGKVKKSFNFRGPTDFINILTKGSIEAVSTANNHSYDYGKRGYESTIQLLESADIGHFGVDYYTNNTYIFEKEGIKIGFTGCTIDTWRNKKQQIRDSFDILKNAGCDLIIATMHAGLEGYAKHNKTQEQIADFLIQNGAQIIIGHHPHVPQGIEVRDGITIIWSLGNFSFGGAFNPTSFESFVAHFDFYFNNNTYTGHQLTIYPVYYSGITAHNNFQPMFVTGEQAQRVMQLIQNDTKFQLNPYEEGKGALQDYINYIN